MMKPVFRAALYAAIAIAAPASAQVAASGYQLPLTPCGRSRE
jgi:hypothetical protein